MTVAGLFVGGGGCVTVEVAVCLWRWLFAAAVAFCGGGCLWRWLFAAAVAVCGGGCLRQRWLFVAVAVCGSGGCLFVAVAVCGIGGCLFVAVAVCWRSGCLTAAVVADCWQCLWRQPVMKVAVAVGKWSDDRLDIIKNG